MIRLPSRHPRGVNRRQGHDLGCPTGIERFVQGSARVTPSPGGKHMQTRHRAAATALLLTATAGMAATGGAAEASGTHHTGDRAARTLTITITSKAGGVKLSDDRFRPGNTIFKVKNKDGKAARGLIQVLRLEARLHTRRRRSTTSGTLFDRPPTNVPAVKQHRQTTSSSTAACPTSEEGRQASQQVGRQDQQGRAPTTSVNLDKDTLTSFKVKGDRQRRALPRQDGFDQRRSPATTPPATTFKAGKNNAASGWMSTTNKALEPHFVDMRAGQEGHEELGHHRPRSRDRTRRPSSRTVARPTPA